MELNPEEHTYKDLKWFQPSDETKSIIRYDGDFVANWICLGKDRLNDSIGERLKFLRPSYKHLKRKTEKQ